MITTVITFLVVLGLLVFVHELGHFVTAKRAGVKVDEFGFGFPPRLLGFYRDPETRRWKVAGLKIKEMSSTIYSVNWVPLGGFVRIKGEQGENPNDTDSFGSKSIGSRIWIISAGVVMNVILAAILLSIGFNLGLPQVLDSENPVGAKVNEVKIQIADIMAGLPAQKEGLQLGDTIVSIDGNNFNSLEQIQLYIGERVGKKINISIQRDNQLIEKTLEPQIIEQINRGGIGVAMVKTGLVSYPWYLAIYKGFETTVIMTKEIIIAFYELFKNLLVSRSVSVDISGPVGIAVITGQVVKLGFIYILQFAALLSLNLAIINFLPFPALDGGRVIFLIIEKIRGRSINSRIEAIIHNIGFAILMLLVIAVTYRDIFRFSDKFLIIWNKISNIF